MKSFFTINKNVHSILFKDKGSKFFGYGFYLDNQENVKHIINGIKKEHYSARHICFAFKIGYLQNEIIRASDDGEPNGTAGAPILNQIRSYNLTNILVVVVRYFGGIKLGVQGLINAYKTTSKMVLEKITPIEKKIVNNYLIVGDYREFNFLQRIVKEYGLSIVKQKLGEKFEIEIDVPKEYENVFLKMVKSNYKLELSKFN